jgi:hypothetical protein
MPFKSESQRRFMYSQHPELAAEFEKATPRNANLPEHVKKMAEGGEAQSDKTWLERMAEKMSGSSPLMSDKSEAEQALHVDDTPQTSSDTVKMATGGDVPNEPGIQDASVSDFLLPYLLGPLGKMGAGEAMPALEGLGETGAVRLGAGGGESLAGKAISQAAPKMEGKLEPAASKLEAYIQGIQKGAKGSPDVEIWNVKGDPDEIAKLGFGPNPGSIPKNVLQAKGVLPPQVSVPGQMAPNSYAEGGEVLSPKEVDKKPSSTTPSPIFAKGGKVERSSLEHPVPNAMMARAMNEGGYPHVTFLENESPATVNKVTHVEHAPHTPAISTETGEKDNPKHMAKGGAIHKAEDRNKEPAKPADINMSHEKKLASIYKAMGVKKYADGGAATDDGSVDLSQLPGAIPTPNPSDPTYWDQIKTALSQVGGALGKTLPTMPAVAEGAANVATTPGMAPAINAALNTNLAGPAAITPPPVTATPTTPSMPPPSGMALPPLPTATPPLTGSVPTATPPAGMPNLATIFNQDTSKLTAGFNPEDRQAIVDKLQAKQHSWTSYLGEALAGFGDALVAKGFGKSHALDDIFGLQKQQRDEALSNFDKARQDRIQKLQLQTQLGDNALKQAAAEDAYGVDDHLNLLIGAPKGTMKKDLPTYFQLSAAQIAAKEKDADLYMKAHSQASTDIDNATKNASVLGIKPSAAQLQASGAKLADNYYNRAKGNILVKPSDGGQAVWIPAQNIGKAKQMDPNLQIQP